MTNSTNHPLPPGHEDDAAGITSLLMCGGRKLWAGSRRISDDFLRMYQTGNLEHLCKSSIERAASVIAARCPPRKAVNAGFPHLPSLMWLAKDQPWADRYWAPVPRGAMLGVWFHRASRSAVTAGLWPVELPDESVCSRAARALSSRLWPNCEVPWGEEPEAYPRALRGYLRIEAGLVLGGRGVGRGRRAHEAILGIVAAGRCPILVIVDEDKRRGAFVTFGPRYLSPGD